MRIFFAVLAVALNCAPWSAWAQLPNSNTNVTWRVSSVADTYWVPLWDTNQSVPFKGVSIPLPNLLSNRFLAGTTTVRNGGAFHVHSGATSWFSNTPAFYNNLRLLASHVNYNDLTYTYSTSTTGEPDGMLNIADITGANGALALGFNSGVIMGHDNNNFYFRNYEDAGMVHIKVKYLHAGGFEGVRFSTHANSNNLNATETTVGIRAMATATNWAEVMASNNVANGGLKVGAFHNTGAGTNDGVFVVGGDLRVTGNIYTNGVLFTGGLSSTVTNFTTIASGSATFGSVTVTNTIAAPSNTAAIVRWTNDMTIATATRKYFDLAKPFTNGTTRAYIAQNFMIECASGEVGTVVLFLDEDGDGTYEEQASNGQFQRAANSGAEAITVFLAAEIGPGCRFYFTNTSAAGPVISPGAGRWVLK